MAGIFPSERLLPLTKLFNSIQEIIKCHPSAQKGGSQFFGKDEPDGATIEFFIPLESREKRFG